MLRESISATSRTTWPSRRTVTANPSVAIKAMAAKLARLVYRMLRYGMKYVDRGVALYEAQHRARQISTLVWKAR